MLPVLTFLFLLSYGLMVLLVVEQNRTITSQRWVITELMSDSKELNSLKQSLLPQHRGQKQPLPKSQNQSPSQSPSSQAAPQANNRSNTSAKVRRNAPLRPPRPASDTPDARRALNSI
jgi:hypothetical protein